MKVTLVITARYAIACSYWDEWWDETPLPTQIWFVRNVPEPWQAPSE